MKYLEKNSFIFGCIATLVSEVLCAILIWIILLLIGMPVTEHLRWFAAAFVPPILLLRHYAKEKDYPDTLKSVIVTFFITFIAFMFFLLKNHYITL